MTSAEPARARWTCTFGTGRRGPWSRSSTPTPTWTTGGREGVVREDDVKAGAVAVIAPAGFMEHAVSENVIAGPAMLRRAQYSSGTFCPGERGGRWTRAWARASRSARWH